MITYSKTDKKPIRLGAVARRGKEFDSLEISQHCGAKIVLRAASTHDIDATHAVVSSKIGAIADAAIIQRVANFNTDNIQIIASGRTGETIGAFAQIMLSDLGLAALTSGSFDPLAPEYGHMASTGDAPAAIYFWAVVATGKAALGIAHMSRFLRQPLYRHADIFTTPATNDGTRIIQSLGFEPLISSSPVTLYRYRRLANRTLFSAA